MEEEWPLPAFHFSVVIGNNSSETAFQEVSGIEQKIETEEYLEGGSTSVYYLPQIAKGNKLTVKRGIATLASPLAKWCLNCFKYKFKIQTKSVLVHLLDENHKPCRSWVFLNAYPVSWKVDTFNSTKNEVTIEEIEFCFSRAIRSK
ncbi:phage tail protein [Celerinatantimonas yamalensis]|uniref:Phage tail protein n=1 Tax=Celerinatantimonas yamalensis TaxID=559956 RepID=A0ABW9G1V8_9GAMM